MKLNLFFKFLTLFFLLTSCASNNIYSELGKTLLNLLEDPKDIEQSEILKIPYSSIQVRIGRSPNSLIVLEEINNEVFKWTSSNNVKIYTINNFIIRLTGLDNELQEIFLDKDHPVITGNFDKIHEQHYLSFYNFRNPNLFNLPIKSTLNFIDYEEINIAGKKIEAEKYEETIEENLIRWKFKNTYWIDKNTNKILKSEQYVTPKIPKIYLKVTENTKKPD